VGEGFGHVKVITRKIKDFGIAAKGTKYAVGNEWRAKEGRPEKKGRREKQGRSQLNNNCRRKRKLDTGQEPNSKCSQRGGKTGEQW